jgi:hypothetical protein
MTAAEALTKWCPFVVIRDANAPAAVNRLSNRDDQCNCLAARCMAWRGTAQSGYCGLAGKDPP